MQNTRTIDLAQVVIRTRTSLWAVLPTVIVELDPTTGERRGGILRDRNLEPDGDLTSDERSVRNSADIL